MSFFFRTMPVVCLCVVLAGCGGGDDAYKRARPKTVNATGTITYNGEPLASATIVLDPQAEGGVAAMCRSDKEGNFSLDAYPPDPGAVPGSYRVSVKKVEPSKQAAATEESHDAPSEGAAGEPESLIPKEYGEFETSGLTMEIPAEGSETLKIELK
jgi:hypothetical protein